MKTLFLDCFSGVSGNMLLGALLALGYPQKELFSIVEKLGFSPSIIKVENVHANGISSVLVKVENPKDQPQRRLKDIIGLIRKTALPQEVKEKSIIAFDKLARAEGKVHGVSKGEIHFHEVGAVDAIVDIVGVCSGIFYLGFEQVLCSPLPLGHGTVKCAHGALPVPVPAVVEILKGVPTYSANREGEHVTPTGATLVMTLADSFERFGGIKIDKSGYGAGTRKFIGGPPNILRAIAGESEKRAEGLDELVIETNIDDMNPEFYEPLSEKLFEAGALDVTLTPCYMKKGRPGILISVIGGKNTLEKIARTLFRESTTIGIRSYPVSRIVCEREVEKVITEFGEVRIKISKYNNNTVGAKPEFEDCKTLAKKAAVPLHDVYNAALLSYKNRENF